MILYVYIYIYIDESYPTIHTMPSFAASLPWAASGLSGDPKKCLRPCDRPDFAIEFSKGSITEGHWEKWIWMTPKS